VRIYFEDGGGNHDPVLSANVVTVKHRLLFVCLGNICRSPTAEGVVRRMLDDAGLAHVDVDSCGTSDYHPGSPPDARTIKHAARRGYDLSTLRARVLAPADFLLFDRIYAMDQSNLANLARACPPVHKAKLSLFLDVTGTHGREVPDPWSHGPEMFERVLDLVEEAGRALVADIKARERKPALADA
jgi:protein-tyrosine phosphatase